jgi:uncharacterized membrane protein (DUF4010 family)
MPVNAETFTLPAGAIGVVTALAAGLVIGLQRGWQERGVGDGGRVAGMRTFGLLGTLGAVFCLLGSGLLAAGAVGLALLNAVSYHETVKATGSLSATTAIAQWLSFGLGALAASGSPMLALGAAVITAVLLDLRMPLHHWLQLIEHEELSAALQLLVLSLVVLPWLPDKAYGPYAALNPYRLWWAVVLVAGLSLSGHVVMRIAGPRRGILWTGMLGGVASSTATTLALARLARSAPQLEGATLAGIWAACGVMFLRVALIAGVLAPELGKALLGPMLVAALCLLGLAARAWTKHGRDAVDTSGRPAMLDNAFGLATALGFGAVLAGMAVLSQAARQALGLTGLYGLALLSGAADVDAITVSVSRMQGAGQIPEGVGAVAIVLAILANLVTKTAVASVAANARLGLKAAAGNVAAMALGAVALLATG